MTPIDLRGMVFTPPEKVVVYWHDPLQISDNNTAEFSRLGFRINPRCVGMLDESHMVVDLREAFAAGLWQDVDWIDRTEIHIRLLWQSENIDLLLRVTERDTSLQDAITNGIELYVVQVTEMHQPPPPPQIDLAPHVIDLDELDSELA